MSSIISELEWDEGLTMPVANAENKKLESEVQSKQKLIVSSQNQLDENEDRVNAMSEHLKNVRQELMHTQNLVNARKREVETEKHMLIIAEREEGRLQQEIGKLEKELDELKERKNIYENNIYKQTKRLEELKSQMNWDQQALEAWLEESARKDEDSMTLSKYSRQDEAKIKELSLRMERLTDDSQDKRKHLEHETMETLAAQIELDKTAEEFRKAHSDRQELIARWENTIEQMQKRDTEMDMLANHLTRLKIEVRKRDETIKEKQQFLDGENANNQELEKKITLAERTAARTRLDYQAADAERDRFANELEALKRTVDRTATDLEVTRSQVKGLKREVEEKNTKLEQAQELREQLQDKLKVATEAELSAEELACRMDELMQEQEKAQKEIDTQLKHLRDQQFQKNQELFNCRKEERNSEGVIQGSRAAIRNLNSKIYKVDHDSLKQQEIIYNQDFAIQQLERRINRMQGERSNEEKVVLEARIKELTDELEDRTQRNNLLNMQLKRLQDDIRRVKRDLEKSGEEKGTLISKIEELNLHNETSEKELKTLTMSKQESMVDENILKLEIKRNRDRLNTKADEVFSLEKRRLQLETAMKERKNEINIHREMLTAQTRAADDERQQISSELHERISKIDKLRKRYEILMVSMAPPEGEEERSQAYYVIKAAQEKEELQREGDDLDAKIRKAEKEIRALENTLKLMNVRNSTYRQSFNKVTDTSDEMDEKQQLDEQQRAVMDKYKYKRRQIRELQDDLQTMSNTLSTLTRDESAYVEMIQEKQNKITQLNKDLEELQVKVDRTAKMNSKYARELRANKKAKDELPEEKDMDIRDYREFNKNVVKMIGEVVTQYPDLGQAVNLYFQQADLPPPPSPGGSRFGSRPGSARSSISSVSARSGMSDRSQRSGRGPTAVDVGGAFGSPGGSRASSQSSARSGRR